VDSHHSYNPRADDGREYGNPFYEGAGGCDTHKGVRDLRVWVSCSGKCIFVVQMMTLLFDRLIITLSAKREARRRWNEDWGDLNSEGNLWWTGSKRQGWIDVMGTSPLGWIRKSLFYELGSA